MKKNKLFILAIIILCVETIILSIVNYNLINELKKYRLLFENSDKALKKNEVIDISDLYILDLNDGIEKNFSDLLTKDIAIIFMFSTHCYSCDLALPDWNNFYKKYKKEYCIFSISKGYKVDIENYIKRNKVVFPVYLLKTYSKQTIFNKTPQALIINKRGKILASINGIQKNLENKFKEVISK
jgi:thiol-disulfide isomerase/thioredoxin